MVTVINELQNLRHQLPSTNCVTGSLIKDIHNMLSFYINVESMLAELNDL